MSRLLKVAGWALWNLVFGFGFSVVGWTAANFTPSPDKCPLWLWNLTFTGMLLVLILMIGTGIFNLCENLMVRK